MVCLVGLSFLNLGREGGMGNIERIVRKEGKEASLFMSKPHAQELMRYTPGYCDKYIVWPQPCAPAHEFGSPIYSL